MKDVPVVLNARAGAGTQGAEVERLHAAFREAGLKPRFSRVGPGDDPRELARRALHGRPPVVVAAGGDGTVSAVADVLRGSASALGVLPVGTLNHFARDLGIPLDAREAARIIAAGRRLRVDVGEVNGRAFVNNASLGLYPNIVRERKRQQRRLGRSKRMAMLWASLAMLDRSPLLHLRLEIAERVQACKAPFVFVGNNDYTLEGFNIGRRERLDRGVLKVYTTRGCSARGLFGLALRALLGRLRQSDDFLEASAQALRVESAKRRLLVALDGEVEVMETPLDFRIRPQALQVLVP